jgi:glycosyltransferase involved in cell wall biosynthesis
MMQTRGEHEKAHRRALIVDMQLPDRRKDAGSARMRELIRQLQADGFGVTFAGLLGGSDAARVDLAAAGVEVLGGDDLIVECLRAARRSQLIVLSRPVPAARLLVPCTLLSGKRRIVYDSVDIHWERVSRQASFEPGSTARHQRRAVRTIERLCVQLSDATVFVSDRDVEVMREVVTGNFESIVLPVIVHPPTGAPTSFTQRRGTLFVGNFSHAPNVDAAHRLVDRLVPEFSPAARPLRIVGAGSTEELGERPNEDVHVLGWVADLAPLYQAALMAVVPLRYGSGVKGKIVEAMAHGLPVVTTDVGAQGIPTGPEAGVLVADSDLSFSRLVSELANDERTWQRLSASARMTAVERFGGTALRDATRRITGDADS